MSGNYFSLDGVGARIWDLCDGSRTVDEIAAELATEYDAAEDEILADAKELVQALVAEGLVTAQ